MLSKIEKIRKQSCGETKISSRRSGRHVLLGKLSVLCRVPTRMLDLELFELVEREVQTKN